ncbi:MAG: ATP-binding protein [Flavobacteriaceae bacterium]|nr:ATP-binding protein [Flavobacteriaceae bacterium]
MSKEYRILKTHRLLILIQIAFGFLFYVVSSFSSLQAQVAEKAVVDLSGFDFYGTEVIPLNGEWEFYWKELLNPTTINQKTEKKYAYFPKLWNEINGESFGYATYRLQIILPDDIPDLSLRIEDFYTSYRLFYNGIIVAENGRVAKHKEQYTPRFEPQNIHIGKGVKTLDLVLQVANFEHYKGGANQEIKLGSKKNIDKQFLLNNGYVYILGGSVLICGLFFMSLSFFNSSDRATFFFGAFSFLSSYYVLGRNPYKILVFFPDLPWEFITRAEHFSFFFGTFIFGFYIHCLYPKEFPNLFLKLNISITGFFSLSSIFLPIWFFTKFNNFFLYYLIVFIILTTFVFYKAIIRKRVGAVFAFTSNSLLFLTLIHIILVYFQILPKNDVIYFSGLYLSFFAMTLLIAYRFANILDSARMKAENAALAKSQFLSNMSHEIRTPLNSVIGLSELLYESKSETEKKEFSQSIKKSGETLLAIINDILDYSKIESNELVIRESPVNLKEFVNDIINANKPLSFEKSISLEYQIENDVPLFVLTDPVRLSQILNNLINNALKFTNHGYIRVLVSKNVERNTKGNILFQVIDTGIGIPEDKLHLLFQRFSQIQSIPNRKFGGTGLGLAISKLLVEALGGQIQVSSVYEKGSTFSFTINAQKTKEIPVELTPISHVKSEIEYIHHFSELKVLLAEDNKINQMVAVKVLKRLGFTDVEIAEDGSQAVDLYNKNHYDLIFMDMEMPILNGLDATKFIRGNPKKDAKPIIIAMTANATIEDEKRCIEAGMNAFIYKPITIQRVYEIILSYFPYSIK